MANPEGSNNQKEESWCWTTTINTKQLRGNHTAKQFKMYPVLSNVTEQRESETIRPQQSNLVFIARVHCAKTNLIDLFQNMFAVLQRPQIGDLLVNADQHAV